MSIKATSLRRSTTKVNDPNLIIRHDYPPLDVNQVFQYRGEFTVIVIIIVIVIIFIIAISSIITLSQLTLRNILTLIWVGFLGVRFQVGRDKIILCLELVRIMLETWILYISTHEYMLSENIPFSTKNLFILLMSAILQNISIFWQKSTFTQSNGVRAVFGIFSSVFRFCNLKGYF